MPGSPTNLHSHRAVSSSLSENHIKISNQIVNSLNETLEQVNCKKNLNKLCTMQKENHSKIQQEFRSVQVQLKAL